MTHLQALQRATDTCNTLLGPQGPAITLRAEGQEIHVERSDVRETLTLQGDRLHGRGGTFDLQDPAQVHQAVLTVQDTTPSHAGELRLLGLHGLAQTHGCAVHAGPSLRWKYSYWMTPVHLIAPHGRVLWLSLYEADYEPGSLSLNAGTHWLAAYLNTLDEETRVLMACTDEENAQDLPEGETPWSVPDRVAPARVRVHEQALLALLRGEEPHTQHLVPADFHKRPEAYEDPALAITRADLQA